MDQISNFNRRDVLKKTGLVSVSGLTTTNFPDNESPNNPSGSKIKYAEIELWFENLPESVSKTSGDALPEVIPDKSNGILRISEFAREHVRHIATEKDLMVNANDHYTTSKRPLFKNSEFNILPSNQGDDPILRKPITFPTIKASIDDNLIEVTSGNHSSEIQDGKEAQMRLKTFETEVETTVENDTNGNGGFVKETSVVIPVIKIRNYGTLDIVIEGNNQGDPQ